MTERMRYECRYVDALNGIVKWEEIIGNDLREVVTGEKPRLKTRFRACGTADALHIRFECEDDHVVATMERRDDPIYLEDVVEVFLDKTGTGEVYYEFEVSPRNVVFDALIHYNGGDKEVDVAWDAKGFHTEVLDGAGGWKTYDLWIPFADLDWEQGEIRTPHHGTEWRWNLYRIDDDFEGNRHYWAWSPTGKVDFHMPHRFGTLVFVKE
ncbi:carbohydrate-binding family 9-like protein [Paenibacillus frigoriresistens]|uniref:carbohydrate-binding family 9-like protein n=1 Tax=Paenibacillus alginolyticus TaxID=59839 RepID=UPI001563FDA2|nr:carbohydrate-binding family 9-like protein [Paenibacillus frigoriresistens]NRF90622.1 carbohydrate-binding family 9-like protein [Paenibacillus frigoriresistens]